MNHSKIEVFPVLLSRLGDDHRVADGSTLPMGCLTSYVKCYQSGALLEHFDIHPLVNRTKENWSFFLEQAERHANSGAIWLFSNYVWNTEDNMAMARQIKDRSPHSLVIVGGPHIPGFVKECEAFFDSHLFVDIAARGEGEKTLAELLGVIAANGRIDGANFSTVNGITFRHQGKLIRTEDRVRSSNLDEFPSPFLTGEFADKSFYDMPGVVLETNRGCPFGCTYCDWGAAILQKIRHFDLERVKKEIDYIGKREPYNLHIADANFGAFERDIEIAKAIVETKKKYGYPKKFTASNAKNGSHIIAKVIQILTEGGLITQGIVAIQTIDEDVLKAVDRSNIKNAKLEKLIDIFKDENIVLSTELLIGLPGQTYDSHKRDLQYMFDRKVSSTAYLVQIMPNAPMNEPAYRDKYKIVSNDQGYVISTTSFSESDLMNMRKLFLAFQFYYMLGVIKYFLYFIQMDKGVMAMDFVDALANISGEKAHKYPVSNMVNQQLIGKTDPRNIGTLELHWKNEEASFLFNHLDHYYDEIFRFAKNEFGVTLTPGEAATIKTVQMSVMPSLGKVVPMEKQLPHDFVAYFQQIKSVRIVDRSPDHFVPLMDFPSGSLTVYALKPKTINDLTLIMTDPKTGLGWELRSPLRFVTPRVRKQSATA